MRHRTLEAAVEGTLTTLRDLQRANRDAWRRRMETDGEPADYIDQVIASIHAHDDQAVVTITPTVRDAIRERATAVTLCADSLAPVWPDLPSSRTVQ